MINLAFNQPFSGARVEIMQIPKYRDFKLKNYLVRMGYDFLRVSRNTRNDRTCHEKRYGNYRK